ncbi:MAG: ricin-type beta-trefoil lectin domain protein [Phaeodactylibacter sp.]|nr:ricin-type beta-trefoil lectin domain protein [Phaeodactylibacter sp.]
MKKQKREYPVILCRKMFIIFMLSLFSGLPLSAQTDIRSALERWGYSDSKIQAAISPLSSLVGDSALVIEAENRLIRVPYMGNIFDLKLPDLIQQPYLYVNIRGGDGGKRKTQFLHIKGGSGATVQGYFKIGNGPNEISPGSTLRFIIGIQGDSKYDVGVVGAFGGGGSGVFLQQAGSTDWRILMVAGGGGGAFADCCSSHSEGKSASTGPDGVEGGGTTHTGGNGGSGGSDGTSTTSAFGGGGLTMALSNGRPVGSVDQRFKRLYGCGHGGSTAAIVKSGGGGGGFSGGGAGSSSSGGGGGGSYFDAHMEGGGLIAMENPKTYNPQNGYADFQFVPDLAAEPIQLAKSQTKCLDVSNYNTANGTNIQLSTCKEDEPAQQWMLKGSDIRLRNAMTKCLDLDQSNTANGTNIQLWDCNGTDAQHWIYDVANQMIRSKIDFNKCLDLVNGNTTGGTNIQLYDCVYTNNQPNQQWVVDGVLSAMPTAADQRIHVAVVPNKCLDVANYNIANGANIQLSECKDHPAQYFTFDGRAIKLQAHPDKCLDLSLSKTDNGKNIQLFDCNGTDAQNWIYDGFAKAFRSAIDHNKCLDVKESNFSNATNIQLWDCNGTDAQQFEIY